MKEEPFFIVNEFLEKERNELAKVLDKVKSSNSNYYNKSVFLRNFSNLMFQAYKKEKHKIMTIDENIRKKVEKSVLEKKRQLLLARLREVEEKEKNTKKEDIILSKESGKTLVSSFFDGTKYIVKEPDINEYHKVLADLKSLPGSIVDNDLELKKAVKEEFDSNKLNFSDDAYDKIRYYLVRDIKKYGAISPLIEDKRVNEIVCDGSGKNIHVNYDGSSNVITNIVIENDEALNKLIKLLASRINQKVSKENPFLSGKLEEDLELQATYGTEFIKPKFVITRIST
ncbi:MAG TPA: hypothetical protein VJG30_00340 [Candidatus Nanoarchaeia archaeon]|nr:hypothetical protein [Candidatus Nanoarchaeia archaeon]